MGVGQSKAAILNEILNETSIEVLNENSSSSSTYINQKNDLTIAGNTGGTISGLKQINAAKINVSALLESSSSGKLQSSLEAALSNEIEQKSASIGYTSSNADVRNIVKNVINTRITNKNLISIKNEVQQSNQIQILANTNVNVKDLVQKNESDLIIKMISKMNSDIVNELQTKGAISTDLSQSTNPLFSFGMGGLFIIIGALLIGFMVFKNGVGNIGATLFSPASLGIVAGLVVIWLMIHFLF